MDIETHLNYAQEDGTRPHFYAKPRSAAEARRDAKRRGGQHVSPFGGSNRVVRTTVVDARGANFRLAEAGFELVSHPTTLTTDDFYGNPEKIRSVYYDEIAEVMKKVTGASHCKVFHHAVRNADGHRKGAFSEGQPQGYAMGIHTDSHPHAADRLFAEFAKKMAEDAADPAVDFTKGRFLYLNAWRNISTKPIERDPLAVCDFRTVVTPDDLVTSDIYLPDRDTLQYKLDCRNAARHRWHYFSRMAQDEILIFKQWDSDPTTSRACFHTAFTITDTPADAPGRESIETRAMLFFPDHEPNTCPQAPSAAVDANAANPADVETGLKSITTAVSFMIFWPANGKMWIQSLAVRGEAGIETIAEGLVADPQGKMGTAKFSAATKAAIVMQAKSKDSEFRKALTKAMWQQDMISAIKEALPMVGAIAAGYGLAVLTRRLRG